MDSDMIQGMIFFAYVIITFITSFGFAHIAGEKGYSKVGYWFWCILFSIAGWIMVAALPDRRKGNDAPTPSNSISGQEKKSEKMALDLAVPQSAGKRPSPSGSSSIPTDGWICSNCGKRHYDYETRCDCGESRFAEYNVTVEDKTKKEKDREPEEAFSTAQMLQSLKKLADDGVISQEYYEVRKKEMMGS